MGESTRCRRCGELVDAKAKRCPACRIYTPARSNREVRTIYAIVWSISAVALIAIGRAVLAPSPAPSKAEFSPEQIKIARDIECAAHAAFGAEVARLKLPHCAARDIPMGVDAPGSDACRQRLALADKYDGPVPDRIASALHVSRDTAQTAMGRVLLSLGPSGLDDCPNP